MMPLQRWKMRHYRYKHGGRCPRRPHILHELFDRSAATLPSALGSSCNWVGRSISKISTPESKIIWISKLIRLFRRRKNVEGQQQKRCCSLKSSPASQNSALADLNHLLVQPAKPSWTGPPSQSARDVFKNQICRYQCISMANNWNNSI